MSQLLLLTNTLQPSTEVLPALGLLSHSLRVAPADGATSANAAHAVVQSLANNQPLGYWLSTNEEPETAEIGSAGPCTRSLLERHPAR